MSEKKYASPAERQRAYRERKRKGIEQESSEEVKGKEEKAKVAHRKWEQRNKVSRVESGKNERYGLIYLNKKMRANEWFLTTRSISTKDTNTESIKRSYKSQSEAEKHYITLLNGDDLTEWKSREHYIDEVRTHIANNEMIKEPTFGHLGALAYIDYEKANRGQTKRIKNFASVMKKSYNRYSSLDATFSDKNQFRSELSKILNEIIQEGVSQKYYWSLTRPIRHGLSALYKYSFLFDIDSDNPTRLRDESQSFIYDTYDSAKRRGDLKKELSHKTLSKTELFKLIDLAEEQGPAFFNSIILTLTLGARPEELTRFINNPKKYLCPKTFKINYNGSIRGLDNLIKKTEMYDLSTVKNPKISLVGLFIISRDNFLDIRPHLKTQSSLRSHKHTKDIYPRRLRATTATMLVFCDLAHNPNFRGSLNMAKERLGHVNLKEAATTYAPTIDEFSEQRPEKCFGIGKGIEVDGVDISLQQPLSDLYLLNRYIEHKSKHLSKEDFSKFKKSLLEVFEIYKKSIDINISTEEDINRKVSY